MGGVREEKKGKMPKHVLEYFICIFMTIFIVYRFCLRSSQTSPFILLLLLLVFSFLISIWTYSISISIIISLEGIIFLCNFVMFSLSTSKLTSLASTLSLSHLPIKLLSYSLHSWLLISFETVHESRNEEICDCNQF